MYTRREFGQILGAGLPLALLMRRVDSTYDGVRLGVITYSFNDMPNVEGQDHVDNIIQNCQQCGAGLIELMSNHVEPVTAYQMQQAAERAARMAAMAQANANGGAGGAARGAGGMGRGGMGGGRGRGMSPEAMKARDELREWRLLTPISHFQDVKKKFDDAGIVVYAYCMNGMGDDFTPQEIDKTFEQAQALGATVISTSTTLDVAQKLAPFADKHQYPIAFHNHANITDPNQFATPESFQKALAMSKYFKINLDIGHFTGANFDAVTFLQSNYMNISHMHVKDGTHNNGPIVPDGQGDTPIKAVMQLLKKNQWPIPAEVEFEYRIPPGSNSVEQVKIMLQYMKDSMA
ncbi:MAG TPA: TIM barrel protein [Candidatus Aquilonibacter sp.]|nr:TIM barrel protein [Candidatus Aquilonibacter sp.]